MKRHLAPIVCCLALALVATSACSNNGSPSSSAGASKVTTAPINSTTDVGAIRGKVDRAAIAADLRITITNAAAAGAASGSQPNPQAAYDQAVTQIARKYGITAADVQDVAKQYGVTP
jgi:hypothetical protein